MFKSIFLPYVNQHTETVVLDSAIAIAAEPGGHPNDAVAHLALLIGIDLPVLMPEIWSSASNGVLLTDAAHERAKVISERLTQRTKNATVVPEIRLVHAIGETAANLAALHARYADISFVPTAAGADSAIAHHYFSAMLMHSGRPVLAVPENCIAKAKPKRVVIAWQPTRETTRAVHDALPFLLAAEKVEVLIVDPVVGEAMHGENPGADIATHLARHGLRVNVVCLPSAGRSVASAINEYTAHSGANLLVAGGYGHNRLKEFLLGGVTRELFHTATVPVLFAH
jgi:nucleotide-binding universal stress UspA family protein